MKDDRFAELDISRYYRGERYNVRDVVAREEPLEIILNANTAARLMRLPGDDVILAAGFCLSEGLLEDLESLAGIHHSSGVSWTSEGEGAFSIEDGTGPGNLVELQTAGDSSGRPRAGPGAGAGYGKDVPSPDEELPAVSSESRVAFSPETILKAPGLLLDEQEVFRTTGGTHGAGVFDTGGRLAVAREDVGRHNAVDKVLGYMFLKSETLKDKALILSGRLSCDMVLKAARAGVPLLCSVSAPTSRGLEVGVRTGITLVGFLRDGSFNVYSHPERVRGDR